ncbi:MAG: DUF3310 domain-containing protein [Candidatus Omnitrophica bacterium]|jgi:hypothetical protein|nr:DUF3310 domain-containing protein [Candidatus Omnitrophota bacterium]
METQDKFVETKYVPDPPGTHKVNTFKDKPKAIFSRDNNPLSTQIGGNHYKNFVIQPVEFIIKNKLNFFQGNVIKYICRYMDKNGIEDLKKIKHYIELYIQLEYPNEVQSEQTM